MEVISPNGKIKVSLEQRKNITTKSDLGDVKQYLFYKVSEIENGEEKEILPLSSLGIVCNDQEFADNLKLIDITRIRQIQDNYTMLTGKRKYCTNTGTERTFLFVNGDSEKLSIIFRVYNNGVAFRYEFPNYSDSSVTITDEVTTYSIPHDYNRWMQKYIVSYEGFYNERSQDEKGEWGFPALFEIPKRNQWLLISEANISPENCATHLSNEDSIDVFKISMPQKGNYYSDVAVKSSFPWSSAWRTISIGNLKDIFESTIITDLSKPSSIENTDWIKPGSVSWIYWANNHGSKDYQKVIEYVDLAVNMKWPYVLIDWEWDQMVNGGSFDDAIAYCHSQGVKPLLWYNSGTSWLYPTPTDRLLTHEKRVKEFEWLQKIGVAGIKVDFFDGDQQSMMKYYQKILEDAAQHHLLVNFHGATIPRGWNRTYPNLMSVEAVYGAEWYNNEPVLTDKAAWHNTVLPFTRNVVGSMDYTPVTFTNSQYPHITTYAHELALAVIFESGLQHFADRPSGYYDLPEVAQDFLCGIPTTWDDSKLINGYPGDHLVIARQKDDQWFIGGLNGTDYKKNLSVSFSFLSNEAYKLLLITDGENEKSFCIREIEITNGNTIQIDCLPRGGFVAEIVKIKKDST